MTHRLAIVDQNKLRLKFDYDPELISTIKLDPRMVGRRWNPEQRAWYAPLTSVAIACLRELKFSLDASIEEWEHTEAEKNTSRSVNATKTIPIIPLPEGLFPFQQEDVYKVDRAFLGRALIANDPGTGKTMEALAWLHIHPELRPAIVVSPAKAKLNWRKHARNWLPKEDIVTLSGTQTEDDIRQLIKHPRAIILVNYDLLILPTYDMAHIHTIEDALACRPKVHIKESIYAMEQTFSTVQGRMKGKDLQLGGVFSSSNPSKIVGIEKHNDELKITVTYSRTLAETLLDLHPAAIVLDECHYTANSKALRSQATKQLAKRCAGILAMSGTPATSRPAQYFTILNLLRPDLFPSFWRYAMRYCNAKHNGYGWDFSGASHTEELHNLLIKNVMVRRRKQDVLPDLPDKLKDAIPMEIDNAREYLAAERDFIAWLRNIGEDEKAERASRAEALTSMEGLKLLAARGKLESVKQWIQDFLDDSDEKLVVFTQHTEIRDALADHFRKKDCHLVVATGGTQTFKVAEQFQNDPDMRIFIANIDAAGDSIDLYAASTVAFVELPMTPGKLQQAEDRLHRHGQKQCVNVHILVAEDTIDDDVAALLDKKQKTLTSILDGGEADKDSLVTELIKQMKRKKR